MEQVVGSPECNHCPFSYETIPPCPSDSFSLEVMRHLPDARTLPVYVLYDEFGHSTIPDFVSTANTIRGYKVSLSIVLQSIAQLSARYGRDAAQSIQGGLIPRLPTQEVTQKPRAFLSV